ncbi:DNA cytosine methyltransferase [Kitasatospora sp. NPDC058218]|uniref:DNA cytosine methyltransferase n=1 Tax=Kitasatospora sp. NPDC058218 TaxID=3346385 RepID=UPI0036DC8179
MQRTSVELFAGGGGLVQASTKAGFRHLLLNEFAPRACETLEANGFARHGEGSRPSVPEPGGRVPLVAGDVRKLEMEYLAECGVDLLAGGPPCQPFSLGGVARGDEDQRNMFPEMFRAVREIRPKAVICENVVGLLRSSFAPYFEYIQRELTLPFVERPEGIAWREHDNSLRERIELGDTDPAKRYDVLRVRVNAADYGVPQIRHRVILVAFRGDLGVDMAEFEKSVRPTHSKELLVQALRDGSYWGDHGKVDKRVRGRITARYADELPFEGPATSGDEPRSRWLTLRDAIKGLPEIDLTKLDKTTEQGDWPDHVGWPGARIYTGHTPNELDQPAKTVKAGVHGVPGGESVMMLDKWVEDPQIPGGRQYLHRYMTVRETARVMTFDDGWKLRGPRGERMRQLGNAVPVRLGQVFAQAVSDALDAAESRA